MDPTNMMPAPNQQPSPDQPFPLPTERWLWQRDKSIAFKSSTVTYLAGWSPPYLIQILVKHGSTQASRCSGMPWREKVLKKISYRWQYPYLTGWQWGPEDISAKDMDHIIKVWVDRVKLFLYLLHRSTTQTMKMHGRRSWSGRGFTRQSVPNPRWGNLI